MDSMPGESDIMGQADIEALLVQARHDAQQQAAPAQPAHGPVRQDEIDSLLAGGGFQAPAGGAAMQASPSATATAARPASGGHKTSSTAAGDDIQYLLDQAEAAIASVNNPSPLPS